jgi:hypothetical protein
MSQSPGSPSPQPAAPHTLSTLAVTTMAALYEAELFSEMEAVRARVLSRGAALFEETVAADGQWQLAYRPMAELALAHVRDLALGECPVEQRRAEIRWTLDAAGF